MSKTLYTLLNEIDHHPESYDSAGVSPAELKKWKKNFSSASVRRIHRRRKTAAAAAAVVLCLAAAVTALTPAKYVAYAAIKSVSYNLSQLLGIEQDLSPYSTAVGQSVSKDGITVTLNDVVLDEGVLYVSHTLTAPEKITDFDTSSRWSSDMQLFINGKAAAWGAGGSVRQADDYNLVSAMEIALNDDIDASAQLDMELVFHCGNAYIGSIQFSASGADLMADTFVSSLDETITLPDGTELTFYKYSSNSMGQRIYFRYADKRCPWDVVLKGEDNLGNPVEFNIRTFKDGMGRMEVSALDNGYVKEEAVSLTLTPYAVKMPEQSGQMSNDFEAVGEAFTVQTAR